MTDPGEEDRKLLTLARAARGRSASPSGAALRDESGRTYVGVDVLLPSLRLSALELCVAQAVAGGSTGAEAAVVVGDDPQPAGLAALADLAGAGVPVLVADSRGKVIGTVLT